MKIPGLGRMSRDGICYRSAAVSIPVLGGVACQLIVEGYDDDAKHEDFHAAVAAFLNLDPSALAAAAPAIFEYYQDVVYWLADDEVDVVVGGTDTVMEHVRPGPEIVVKRDHRRDRHVYVSVECECDWEPEHGLQIVFRDGTTVTKVGPYDGHLTNAAAYARDDLEGVIYYRVR
jgi:hypothetical protein